jgi:iron-sulfur cluster protein
MSRTLRSYHESLKQAIGDPYLEKVLDKFAREYRISRAEAFKGTDEPALFEAIREDKENALLHNEGLYEIFRLEAEKKGVIVHRAKDGEECADIIMSIALETASRRIVKTKSMTAEEIGLGKALKEKGLELIETDLGERIVELRGENPSHMVLPAIHLSKEQVAETFAEHRGKETPGDIEKLVKIARRELRAKFCEADMGITGANFAIAESGTIGIMTNEGNGRLSSTLPGVLVSVVGLEKLVPGIREALRIIDAVPKNATAQPITSYVSFLTGTFESLATRDRKKIFHVIFLDNGRSELIKNKDYRAALRCVRCGACANVCPVYRMTGGHLMGHVYIGAIGLVLTRFYHGIDEARRLVHNCVACGACVEVCPAKIDLPRLICRIRGDIIKEEGGGLLSSLLSAALPHRNIFHGALKIAGFLQKPFESEGKIRHLPFLLEGTAGFKDLPALAPESFRELLKKEESPDSGKGEIKVSVFSGCAHEFLFPMELIRGVRLMRRKGARVSFPSDQGCCGLPALTLGEIKAAVKTAESNIRAFAEDDSDYIVSLCPSCSNHLKNTNLALLEDKPKLREEAERIASKIIDFSSFLLEVLGYGRDDFIKNGETAAYHSPCHQRHGLKSVKAPRELLKTAASYLPSDKEDLCCGFGGSYSLKFPEISGELAKRKLKSYEGIGASVIVTDCPGCVMRLKGVDGRKGQVPAEHMADFLYRLLKDKS